MLRHRLGVLGGPPANGAAGRLTARLAAIKALLAGVHATDIARQLALRTGRLVRVRITRRDGVTTTHDIQPVPSGQPTGFFLPTG